MRVEARDVSGRQGGKDLGGHCTELGLYSQREAPAGASARGGK